VTDLAERYGTRAGRRNPLLVAGVALLAVAGLAWVVWVVVLHSTPAVQSHLLSYDVVGEHRVETSFAVVRRDGDVAVSCLVRAFAEDHSVVGEINVSVDRSMPASATVTRAVRTERRATSVELVRCLPDGRQPAG
jgi:hypothetical protein